MIAVAGISMLLASCEGGANLPEPSRSLSIPTPSRTVTVPSPSRTRTPAPTESDEPATPTSPSETALTTSSSAPSPTGTSPTDTETETTSTTSPPATASASTVPAASSSTPVWPWVLLGLVVLGAGVAYVIRSRSTAAADARRRALQLYGEAMALRDQAAVLPMSTEADRARLTSEVFAGIDLAVSRFEALATEPAMGEAAAELSDVQLSLGALRSALLAQAAAGGLDPELLRQRTSSLDDSLQAFRRRLSAPPF